MPNTSPGKTALLRGGRVTALAATAALLAAAAAAAFVPAPAAASAPSAPSAGAAHLKLDTLTVEATNLHGKPDTGDCVSIASVDNPKRFNGQTKCFSNGSAKFRVPAGH